MRGLGNRCSIQLSYGDSLLEKATQKRPEANRIFILTKPFSLIYLPIRTKTVIRRAKTSPDKPVDKAPAAWLPARLYFYEQHARTNPTQPYA